MNLSLRSFALVLVCVIAPFRLAAQRIGTEAPVGAWTTISSTHYVEDLTLDRIGRLWAATKGGVFVHDPSTGRIERLVTPDQGLHRLDATAIEFLPSTGEILVGFPDGMLNAIDPDDFTIRSIGDIHRSQAFPDKSIHGILVRSGAVFVASGFGLVVYDPKADFVRSTALRMGSLPTGMAVNDLVADEWSGRLWVATDAGVASAYPDSDLSLPSNWISIDAARFNGEAPQRIGVLEDRIFVSTTRANYMTSDMASGLSPDAVWTPAVMFGEDAASDYEWDPAAGRLHAALVTQLRSLSPDGSVEIRDLGAVLNRLHAPAPREEIERVRPAPFTAGLDQSLEPGALWAATFQAGALLVPAPADSMPRPILANGPSINAVRSISFTKDGFVAATTELYDGNGLLDNQKGFSIVRNGTWTNYNKTVTPFLRDANVYLTLSALAGETHHYVGTWGGGILRFDPDTEEITLFDETNSDLRGWEQLDPGYIVVSGLEKDSRGDIWALSRYASRALVHHEEGSGDWTPVNAYRTLGSSDLYASLFIDSNDIKWIPLQTAAGAGRGLLVLDTGADPTSSADDEGVVLNAGAGAGNLPNGSVRAVVEDLNGEIWVGTDRGIARFLFPELVVSGGAAERQAQWLIAEDPGEASPFLLRDIQVTAMAVNGANQKWIGTPTEGIWLLNEEGSRILAHHTADNSPLLSNAIRDLAFDPRTGELYISTSLGLSVLTDVARGGEPVMDELVAYPNPFLHDRHDRVLIDGLADRTTIRIIAVDGTRVRTLDAAGGRAEWDGLDDAGREVASGVYLLIALSESGEDRGIGKLVVIR